MNSNPHMTLKYLWQKYYEDCINSNDKPYMYRQYCEHYSEWITNEGTAHFTHKPGYSMEIDFAGDTFRIRDELTGKIQTVVVYVGVLPFSQRIYAEGMLSTREPQWIEVNNHALKYFQGVPLVVVCDNCKQAVLTNKDWIDPILNPDFSGWAEHNNTCLQPAKVRKPKYKPSVENAVGILEKGIFLKLKEMVFLRLEDFNNALWEMLDALNEQNFEKENVSRNWKWREKELQELQSLPNESYLYTERKIVHVDNNYHFIFDKCYYSVPWKNKGSNLVVTANIHKLIVTDMGGQPVCEWERGLHLWNTRIEDMPRNCQNVDNWSSAGFLATAGKIGPYTHKVIQAILKSRPHEEQAYRMCVGVIDFKRKYSADVLEACCVRAVKQNHMTYTFIKNTITGVAHEKGTQSTKYQEADTSACENRNSGALLRNEFQMSTKKLLNKTEALLGQGEKDEKC